MHNASQQTVVRSYDRGSAAHSSDSANERRKGGTISELADRRKIGVIVTVARGKTIFSDGEDAKYSYKVVEGAVRMSKIMLDGRRQIAEFALPGDMFGFESRGVYGLSAEAVTPVTLVRYSRAHIERLGEEFCDINRELMALLRRGWTSAQAHLVMLGRQTAKERVAAFLVALAEQRGVTSGQSLGLPMGRQDIADYLGLTIETVCRTLTEFKSAKILSIPDRRRIIICDIGELERLAQGEDKDF